jgi:hypothetical protein
MASTYSTDLKLELMVTGENAGTWGTKTNTNLNLLQQSIAGVQGIDVSASDVTLVMSNAQLSNARNMVLVLNGSLTANRQVLIPNGIEKFYVIHDQTTRNGFSLTIKTVSGTGFAIETTAGSSDMVACFSDGTDVYEVSLNTLSGSIAAAQLDSFAVTSTKLASFAVTSAKVASYAVTSNKLATNAVTAVKIANSTITLNKLSATGSPSASTYLRGDNTWGAISSSPATLKSNITLKTAASITAGKLASINSSGEIVNLPTLNTYGTLRTNSSTTAYSAISTDGSRAIKYSVATSIFTFSGIAISNSGNPTNGTVNVTENVSNTAGAALFFPVGPDKFIVCAYTSYGVCESENPNNYNGVRVRWFMVTIDSSGNCTKGAVVNQDFQTGTSGGNCGSITRFNTGQYNNNIITYWVSIPQITINGSIYWSGSGTTLVGTSDADAQQLTSAGTSVQPTPSNSLLTSSDIMCTGRNNSWVTASWNPTTRAIGTVTSTTVAGDYLQSGLFYKLAPITDTGAAHVLFFYTNTSNEARYVTYSINQTTGALTQVETGTPSSALGAASFSQMIFKDASSAVTVTPTGLVSQSWSSGAIQGFNNAGYNTTGSSLRYNGTDLYYFFNTNITNFPTNQGYQVNAYSTETFNYAGVTETTTSTSPASIITDGVAAGFTSLTPGTIYYAATPLSGEVSTSSASGLLIGKAISSTQILLQRSNTQ